jgi:hypothetical protein
MATSSRLLFAQNSTASWVASASRRIEISTPTAARCWADDVTGEASRRTRHGSDRFGEQELTGEDESEVDAYFAPDFAFHDPTAPSWTTTA